MPKTPEETGGLLFVPESGQAKTRRTGAQRWTVRSTQENMFGPKTQCVVVVGAQWGDEGKGKVVDVLAERADLVVRYQGGANAGHTVDTGEGKSFVLHQIPSGILQGAVCVVGNGVVLDPEQMFTELDELTSRGVRTEHKLYVSDRAHLTLPYHKLLDRARERREQIGTTGRGIGP